MDLKKNQTITKLKNFFILLILSTEAKLKKKYIIASSTILLGIAGLRAQKSFKDAVNMQVQKEAKEYIAKLAECKNIENAYNKTENLDEWRPKFLQIHKEADFLYKQYEMAYEKAYKKESEKRKRFNFGFLSKKNPKTIFFILLIIFGIALIIYEFKKQSKD